MLPEDRMVPYLEGEYTIEQAQADLRAKACRPPAPKHRARSVARCSPAGRANCHHVRQTRAGVWQPSCPPCALPHARTKRGPRTAGAPADPPRPRRRRARAASAAGPRLRQRPSGCAPRRAGQDGCRGGQVQQAVHGGATADRQQAAAAHDPHAVPAHRVPGAARRARGADALPFFEGLRANCCAAPCRAMPVALRVV